MDCGHLAEVVHELEDCWQPLSGEEDTDCWVVVLHYPVDSFGLMDHFAEVGCFHRCWSVVGTNRDSVAVGSVSN